MREWEKEDPRTWATAWELLGMTDDRPSDEDEPHDR